MPSYFIEHDMREGDRVRVSGPLLVHLRDALRVRPGEVLTLVDGAACLTATVEQVGKDALHCRVTQESTLPPAPFSLTLAIGMPKGKKLEEIVQKAVELGADRIVPVYMERSIPRPTDAAHRLERLQVIAREAAQQSARGSIPTVVPPCDLAAFLGEPAPALGVVLWEGEARRPLWEVVDRPVRQATVVIGPEGGLTAGEVARMVDRGFVPATLGRATLRTETACAAALAQVALLLSMHFAALTAGGDPL